MGILGSLAYDPTDGSLYGLSAGEKYYGSDGANEIDPYHLFKINKQTGETTLVGNAVRGGNLAFNCAGQLFMRGGGGGNKPFIYKVDKTNAQVEFVAEIPRTLSNTGYSLAFDGQDDEKFYFISNWGNELDIFSADPSENETTIINMALQRSSRHCDIIKNGDADPTFVCMDNSAAELVSFTVDGFGNSTNDVLLPFPDHPRSETSSPAASYYFNVAFEWSTNGYCAGQCTPHFLFHHCKG